MNTQLRRLKEIDARIQEILQARGLCIIPVDFEIVSAQRMFEIMAYGLPVNFRHWSRGRDYERLRTIYEHSGGGLPYETVLNTTPPKAFLMETNPFPIQVMVIAHVYAHVDFFRQNRYFADVPGDIVTQAYEAAKRFGWYEEHHGLSRLEPLVDAGLALQFNIDPDTHIRRESLEEQFERIFGDQAEAEAEVGFDPFYSLYPRSKKQRPDFRTLSHQTPLEPTRDVIGYIIENSPKPLADWEQDVLSAIRTQGHYFYPQLRTKIINEGWAAFWHERVMRQLFEENALTPEEHGYYAQYHAAVLAENKFFLNPYRVGKHIFEDIETRWDKGRHGKQWLMWDKAQQHEDWDTGEGKGGEKILSVRRVYTDRMFIEQFLTDALIDELELYIYTERKTIDGGKELIISERRPEIIRQQLKEQHADAGMPRILVDDGNYGHRRELYLRHVFEGAPLDLEYLQKTIAHVHYLWGGKVHLETVDVIEGERREMIQRDVVHHYDGRRHTKSDLGWR